MCKLQLGQKASISLVLHTSMVQVIMVDNGLGAGAWFNREGYWAKPGKHWPHQCAGYEDILREF